VHDVGGVGGGSDASVVKEWRFNRVLQGSGGSTAHQKSSKSSRQCFTFCARTSPAVNPTSEVSALVSSGCLVSKSLYFAQADLRIAVRGDDAQAGK